MASSSDSSAEELSAGIFSDALLSSSSSVSHGPPLVIQNHNFFLPANSELNGLTMLSQYLGELEKDDAWVDVFVRRSDPQVGIQNMGKYNLYRDPNLGTTLSEIHGGVRPASKSDIAALPTVKIKTAAEKCSICLCELVPGTEAIRMADCEHVFHKDCISNWFQISNKCPNCRSEVPLGDRQYPNKFVIDLLRPFASAPNLYRNLSLLSHDQIEVAKMLVEIGQSHLFRHWPALGTQDDEKKAFLDQVALLDSRYPGGLAAYVERSRGLLADSRNGKNPFDGFTPRVPIGVNLSYGDEAFMKFEEAGIKEAQNAAFVLVAGCLGEHLGYSGIKVALPCETTTGCCFLQHYVESILALQEASCKITGGQSERDIPFAIMTSDDTHEQTDQLLVSNSYFGMKPTQIKLLKQEKVACLEDNDARLALDPNNTFIIQTKHHGDGDVHALLYSSGVLEEWQRDGVTWVIFFHETNGLLFKTIPALLGVSAAKGYHVNSLAVPRKPKEAIGRIAMLTHTDGRSMVINVEYNELDTLLRANGNPDGDVEDCQTGYSYYPGNTNQLIMELDPYLQQLKKTRGAINEFVNPKYKDATKTAFKSSTRLECVMQDYPKTLPPSSRVGFTVMDAWVAYAPVKDNPEDAAKVPKCYQNYSAMSAEMAVYRANSLILKEAGVQVEVPVRQEFNGQDVEWWPRVVWKPKWGLTFSDVKKKVVGSSSISPRSTLDLNGRNIFIENLSLDGALVVESHGEAEVIARGSVQNKGWTIEKVEYKDASVPEEIRMRGFRFQKVEQFELKASTSNH